MERWWGKEGVAKQLAPRVFFALSEPFKLSWDLNSARHTCYAGPLTA
jgi:hypothetical protein